MAFPVAVPFAIDFVELYVGFVSNLSLFLGIYNDSGGHPGTLLASGEYDASFSALSRVAPGTYWLAVASSDPAIYFLPVNAATTVASANFDPSGGMPATWPSTTTAPGPAWLMDIIGTE